MQDWKNYEFHFSTSEKVWVATQQISKHMNFILCKFIEKAEKAWISLLQRLRSPRAAKGLLKKHQFRFLRLQKLEFHFFARKTSQKHELDFLKAKTLKKRNFHFFSTKNAKKHEFHFCKLEKSMSFIFCKPKKCKIHEFDFLQAYWKSMNFAFFCVKKLQNH